MVKVVTPTASLGDMAPDFSLLGVDGSLWRRDECVGENGLVVMFICNHCPYVKAIQEDLIQDMRELNELGVGSVAIMPNDVVEYPEDRYEEMQKVSVRYNYPFPYLNR